MASKRTRFTYAEDRQLIQMAAASATLEKAAARFGTSVETIERKAKSLQLTLKKRGGHKRLSPRLDPWPKARGTPERRPYSLPYSFVWNGSAVTEWDKTGLNDFDWWVFNNVANPTHFYEFGETPSNVNDPTHAVVYQTLPAVYLTNGTITVAPAVPEPSTWAMMIIGFAGVGFMAYRRRAKADMLRAA